jgi:hypothetical protein
MTRDDIDISVAVLAFLGGAVVSFFANPLFGVVALLIIMFAWEIITRVLSAKSSTS